MSDSNKVLQTSLLSFGSLVHYYKVDVFVQHSTYSIYHKADAMSHNC